MIITQTRQSRTFVGSLNPGADVIDALRNICVDNAIFCALFSGVGYMKKPQIRTYDVDLLGFRPPTVHEGTFHCVALHGNASLRDKQTVLRVHVIGTLSSPSGQEAKLLSGELVGAEVISFEFSLSSVDDLRLYRAPDDRTGLDPWLHMDIGTGPLTLHAQSDEVPIIETAPGAGPPTASPGRRPEAPVESETEEQIEVDQGDWLEHPTLGRCEVLDSDGDERVTIRLESGRQVELHVGLLDLTVAGDVDGARLIKVAIRRRR